jgi:hypothetical protein
MEAEGSLLCFQGPDTCLHPEPDESNPYPSAISLTSILISSNLRVSPRHPSSLLSPGISNKPHKKA